MQTTRSHLFIAEWRRLSGEGQRELARDIARAVLQGALGRPEEEELARALKFRVGALRRSSEDGLAAAIRVGIVQLEARPFLDLLVQVHFSSRAEVLSTTYDLLGVEHDGTEVAEPVLEAPLDLTKVQATFAGRADAEDAARLGLCLVVMGYVCSAAWQPGVAAALEALRSGSGKAMTAGHQGT
ncbi:MAG: hypothetical protein ABI689_03505 [Thermoanaerobaculia bacterium]